MKNRFTDQLKQNTLIKCNSECCNRYTKGKNSICGVFDYFIHSINSHSEYLRTILQKIDSVNEDYTKLPFYLPKPEDDGKTNHLIGLQMPEIILPSTKNGFLNFSNIGKKFAVLYFFPMMGMPGKDLPSGWNEIPGARGCTPQNIAFSKNNDALENLDAVAIGVFSQSMYDLEQLSDIRKLSQQLVADDKLEFQEKLNVPTLEVEGKIMYKRITLIVKDSKIIKVFYPVFPPDEHIFEILDWLKRN